MAIKNLFLQVILWYALFTVVVYFLSDFIIFPVPKSSYQDTPKIIKLTLPTGEKISAVFLFNPKATDTILFSHGNGEDLGNILPYLEAYRDQGFSVFAYDYPGYGTSQGRPSEQSTYAAITAAYHYLTDTVQISPAHIILHGRSLGTGPSLELAMHDPVKAVILESGMITIFRVMTQIPLVPVDKFRNNVKIQKLSVPVLIIHGKQDEVIPFWHSKKLFELAKNPKYFLPVEHAKHNDVPEVAGKKYWDTIKTFTKQP